MGVDLVRVQETPARPGCGWGDSGIGHDEHLRTTAGERPTHLLCRNQSVRVPGSSQNIARGPDAATRFTDNKTVRLQLRCRRQDNRPADGTHG